MQLEEPNPEATCVSVLDGSVLEGSVDKSKRRRRAGTLTGWWERCSAVYVEVGPLGAPNDDRVHAHDHTGSTSSAQAASSSCVARVRGCEHRDEDILRGLEIREQLSLSLLDPQDTCTT